METNGNFIMEVLQKEVENKGSFYIEENGKKVAEMTYVWAGKDRIIIDHTAVHPSLKGKGAGKLMVHTAVDFARKNSIKIIPLCAFAKSVFDKSPELRNVL
jgi:predicted GNAT family acetyltransferase